MNEELDYLSAERLWLKFFRQFDRDHGIAMVQELWRIHVKQQTKGNT